MSRITEPFVKMSYVFWLLSKGANRIHISIDGAEPDHEIVAEKLMSLGYFRQPLLNSSVNWTGLFLRRDIEVIISAKQGIDIVAKFPDGQIFLAECKGEPTSSGVKSGLDRTALYTALGQLLITADDECTEYSCLIVVLPSTPRLRDIVKQVAQNRRFRKIGVGLVLVDESGDVKEITKPGN